MINNSTDLTRMQEDMLDLTRYADKAYLARELADVFDNIDADKARRMRACGELLGFAADADGRMILRRGSFCRIRLCPMCCWRRAVRVYGQVMAIHGYLGKEAEAMGVKRQRSILLTLTVRSCPPEQLGATIDAIMQGWQRLTQRAAVRDVWRGGCRVMEITVNRDRKSGSYLMCHPHIHAIATVAPSYWGRAYLSQADYTRLWQESMRLDYVPVCDVRAIKRDYERGAVAEVAKYTVKPVDYLRVAPGDRETIITVLDSALRHRRLLSLFGSWADGARALHLPDIEADDGPAGDIADSAEMVWYAYREGLARYARVQGCKAYEGAQTVSPAGDLRR